MTRHSDVFARLVAARFLLGAAAAGAALLGAQAHAQTTQAVKPSKPAAWVHAPSKHNGSGVVLSYSVPARLGVDSASSVELRFSGVTAEDAQVEFHFSDGLTATLADGTTPTSQALPAGRATTISLQVVPHSEGTLFINVFTRQGGRSSAQSVPLRVGDTQAKTKVKPERAAQTTPEGENVISLPSSSR
ncbi:MAG TPA: hypothetical protein VN680_03125 [Burkholderiaceae bacterium]|jgi:hypothetical protein|nr:hypothetical protein [Burkholderiaceae bacterium]